MDEGRKLKYIHKYIPRYIFPIWVATFPFINFFPLFPVPNLEYPRWMWLNIGAILFALVIAFRLCTRALQFRHRTVFFLAALFFIWLGVTTLTGYNPEQSVWGSPFRLQGFLTYSALLFLFFFAPILISRHLTIFVRIMVLGSLAAGLFAVFDFPLLFEPNSPYGYGGRLLGSFGQPNFLAEYLVLLLPFHLLLWMRHPLWTAKTLIVLSCSLSIVVILLTFSRSAILGLFVVGAMSVPFVWSLQRRLRWIVSSSIVLSVITFSALIMTMPQFAAQRERIFRERRGSIVLMDQEIPPTENRVPIWLSVRTLIAMRPVFGWGMENLGDIIASGKYGTEPELYPIYVDRAHSYLLDLAVGGGIPLLVLFLLLCIAIIRLPVSHAKALQAGMFFRMSVLAFLAMSLVNIPSISLLVLFWVILGLLGEPFRFVSRTR